MEPMKPGKAIALSQLNNTAVQLRAAEETLPGRIRNAKKWGASWAEIGAILGVSRQAAQQKYSALVDIEELPLSDEIFNGLFQAPQAPEQSKVQAPKQSNVQAPKQSNVQAPEQSNVQAPEQSNVQAPEQSNVQAPEQSNVQAPEQSKVQAPEQSEDR